MLQDFEEEDILENVSIVSEVPGIEQKDCQAPHLMNALTLEMIEGRYNPWNGSTPPQTDPQRER